MQSYEIYGACIAEVEIDVLTGEKNVRRVDLMADTGKSISPLTDLGQVEGSFVMGMGNWLQEEITFDASTGRLLNFDTWVRLKSCHAASSLVRTLVILLQTYKPPSSQDIPNNFRTYLYDSEVSTGTSSGILSSKVSPSAKRELSLVTHLWSPHFAGDRRAPAANVVRRPPGPQERGQRGQVRVGRGAVVSAG